MTGLKISTSFNEHDLSSEDTITIPTHLTAMRELIISDSNAKSQIIKLLIGSTDQSLMSKHTA